MTLLNISDYLKGKAKISIIFIMRLKFLLLIPTCLAVSSLLHANIQSAETPLANRVVVPNKGDSVVEPFDQREVLLLDGPFKRAQELNHRLLLNSNLDKLIYPFRREAGIPSPLKGNDALGWPYTGHTMGHFLSASALLYRNTGDAEIKKKADEAVALLAECQDRIGDGYLGGMPERSILELEKLVVDRKAHADVPWYCLHKVYAGLLDMYLLTGNTKALEILKKAADWADKNTSQLSDRQMQAMLSIEHGGMKELLLNLYAVSGQERYLRLAERFTHHAVEDPILAGKDPLDGLHANTQIPKFIGLAREYELTGEPRQKTGAVYFWDTVTGERSYVTGGNSSMEKFSPKASLSSAFGNTTETCNEYNMLKLTRHLICLDPKPAYADYFERTLFNQILSSRNPSTGEQIYYQQLKSGSDKSAWRQNPVAGGMSCCHGTGLESNSKYEESIYFHSTGKGTSDLYVNLFIASVLDWKSEGITLRQETDYPDQGSSKLIMVAAHPRQLRLMIRRPWWATKDYAILVNGVQQADVGTPGSYVAVDRTWMNGDSVEVRMPMQFRFEGFKDNPKLVAILYGPLVMAAETSHGNTLSVINSAGGDPLATLKPVVGKSLEFSAPSDVFSTSPNPLPEQRTTFRPLFRMVKESYAVYWLSK